MKTMRMLSIATLLAAVALLPAGCSSTPTSTENATPQSLSQTTAGSNPASYTITLPASASGRAVVFLNVASTATYNVTIEGTQVLANGKTRTGGIYTFTGKSSLNVTVSCSDPNVKLRPWGMADLAPGGTTYTRAAYFDLDAPTATGIFTTPVGVIVQLQ